MTRAMPAHRPVLMERLRQETRDLHDAIEQALDLETCLASIDAYRALLIRWHGFLAAFEPAIEPLVEDGFFGPRRKLALIREDLARLGLDAAAIARLPVCRDLPQLRSEAEALGALYVLEGSTLGGQLIAREARQRLGPEVPLRFYYPYGEQTGQMWRTFRAEVAARVGPDAEDGVVQAARATFAHLSRWLTKQPASGIGVS